MRQVWKSSSSEGGIEPLAELHQGVEIKLVSVTLPVNFLHDVLVVVITESPAHLVVVHVGLRLPLSPPPRHLVGVGHLELAGSALPGDVLHGGGVGEELQQELPQLDLAAGLHRGRARRRVERVWGRTRRVSIFFFFYNFFASSP